MVVVPGFKLTEALFVDKKTILYKGIDEYKKTTSIDKNTSSLQMPDWKILLNLNRNIKSLKP